MSDWALVTTPPNAEHFMTADLYRCGYQYRIFKRKITQAHQGRVIHLLRPAFPRYVFVPFEQCWNILRDIWRIVGIVAFGDQVARVRGHEVDALITRCSGGNILPQSYPQTLASGDHVIIGGEGLFSGHDALYDSAIGDGKLRVTLNMMGRMVGLDVDQRDISSVATKQSTKPRKRKRHGKHQRKHRTI